MKIVVVGAGIIGTSVAYRLAEAGAEVVIVDENRVGGGTSCVTYAWVNACEKLSSRAYFDLNMAGRAAHGRIVDDLGGGEWYPRPGIVQWQDAEAEAGGVDTTSSEEKFRRLRDWGYPAEMLPAEELRRLEPDVDADAYGSRPVILYPQDGWCYATQYAGRVAGAACNRHNARLVIGKVARIDIAGGRTTGVTLADGIRIEADAVVNCAGRWANSIIEAETSRIPLKPTSGLVAYTAPAGIQLERGLRTPTVNLRPDGGGRLLLRAGDIDKLVDGNRPVDEFREQAEELMRRARVLLPALRDVPIEAVRIAIRPEPADSYSAIGRLPDVEGLYVAITHSGVTLAPFIGEGLTREILHSQEVPEFAAFRPARFFREKAI